MGPKLKTSVAPASGKDVGNTVKKDDRWNDGPHQRPFTEGNIIELYPGRVKKQPAVKNDKEEIRILNMRNKEDAFLDMFPAHIVYENGEGTVVYVDDERHPLHQKNMVRGGQTALEDHKRERRKSWDSDW